MRSCLAFARAAVLALFFVLFSIVAAQAQQTNVFTYQGRLNQSSIPANATFNMVFDLHNAPTGGSVLDTENESVPVTNGIFTVELDFDAVHFTGQDLYLQITLNGTPLTPRQRMMSVPYATRSTKAASADALSIFCAACVTDAMVSDTLTSSNLVAGSSVVSDAEVDNNLTINGGTIDGTPIGGTTPATGTFTTGSFTRVISGAGTFSLPGYTFSGDPDTGLSSGGPDTLLFSAGGGVMMTLQFNGIGTFVPINGTVAQISMAQPDGNDAPSVHNLTVLWLYNTDFTSIFTLADGVEGQCVVLLAYVNSNSTVVEVSNGGSFNLKGTANYTMGDGDTLTVCRFGVIWYETSRSDN